MLLCYWSMELLSQSDNDANTLPAIRIDIAVPHYHVALLRDQAC